VSSAARRSIQLDELVDERSVPRVVGSISRVRELAVLERRGGDLGAADVEPDELAPLKLSSAAAAAVEHEHRASPRRAHEARRAADSSGSPNARATAVALSAPETRNDDLAARLNTGSVSVTRGTLRLHARARHADDERCVSSQRRLAGEQRGAWAVGPRPSSARSSAGVAELLAHQRLVGAGGAARAAARLRSA
jgi:hypothetical protein